jgi:hypothetical protein
MTCKRGAFILFEGLDRCGKSTQVRLLLEHLRNAGIPVAQVSFPGSVARGPMLLPPMNNDGWGGVSRRQDDADWGGDQQVLGEGD